MTQIFRNMLLAGLVSAAALSFGCTRTYEHQSAEQANYTNKNAPANADVVPDGTQEPNAELPIQAGPQYGAAGQTNDINANQDMTGENANVEMGYGGSGTAGMDGGMKHHMDMDGGMMMHHGEMMDGGMMMDHHAMMDGGMKMKTGKMKK